MDHQDATLTRLESEAAETVGAMRELFKEFEKRIGEVISVQRLSSSETRTEGAQVLQHLQELARCSKALVEQQRGVLGRIEQEWQLRIDGNAQRAGEAQAKAFGESIAQGLQGRHADLAAQVETSTRQLTWKSSLRWVVGIALAIPLTVAICVSAFVPNTPENRNIPGAELTVPELGKAGNAIGLSPAQTRELLSKVSVCEVAKTEDWHACIEVDSPPRMGLGAVDKPRVVVRGM
jgi:hypothetical protein